MTIKKLFSAFFMLFSFNCHADEYFKFVNLICLENAGFLEIFSTGVSNIEAYKKETPIVEEIESKSSLVYGRGKIVKSCNLSGGKYEVEIIYTEPAERGECMGNPGASLTLKRNEEVLVKEVYFDWSCHWPDINRLKIDGGKFITLCGTNYSDSGFNNGDFCVIGLDFPGDGKPVDNEFIRKIANEQLKDLVERNRI